MPTMIIAGEAADGYIRGTSTVYATARSTASLGDAGDTGCLVGQQKTGATYNVWRTYWSFDTSVLRGLPVGATVTAASLFASAAFDGSNVDFQILCYRYAWAEALADNLEANYDGAYGGSSVLEGTFRSTASGFVAGTWYSMSVDESALDAYGDTKYVFVSNKDVAGTAPTTAEYVNFYANEAGSPAYLLVTWTDPGGRLTKTASAEAVKSQAWYRVGPVANSIEAKTAPGWLGGVRVTATDADGDVVVNLWDSPDSTTTDDIEVARLSLGKAAKDVREVTFPDPGVELQNGLYVAITGDCLVETWLR